MVNNDEEDYEAFKKREEWENSEEYKKEIERIKKEINDVYKNKEFLAERKGNVDRLKVKNEVFEIWGEAANRYLYTLKYKGRIIDIKGDFEDVNGDCSFHNFQMSPNEFFDFDAKHYPEQVAFELSSDRSIQNQPDYFQYICLRESQFVVSFTVIITLIDLAILDIIPDKPVFSYLQVLEEVGYEIECDEEIDQRNEGRGMVTLRFPATGNVRDGIYQQLTIVENILEKAGYLTGAKLMAMFRQ